MQAKICRCHRLQVQAQFNNILFRTHEDEEEMYFTYYVDEMVVSLVDVSNCCYWHFP